MKIIKINKMTKEKERVTIDEYISHFKLNGARISNENLLKQLIKYDQGMQDVNFIFKLEV